LASATLQQRLIVRRNPSSKISPSLLVYLDDVIVTGQMFQQQQVFQRFQAAYLKLNQEKCQLP
jgi:hypothetical protein